MQIVPEPRLEHAVELSDGDAGLRQFHLYVAGPGVGKVSLRRVDARRCLQPGQFIQKPAGHDLTRQSTSRQRGRSIERLDDDGPRRKGVVEHYQNPKG